MKRFVSVTFITIAVTLAASAQPASQQLRDRDPDIEAAKKLAAEQQQANFHWGPFYLWSRVRITDAGFSEGSYLPASGNEGGLSLSVDAPQRLYFVPHRKTVLTFEVNPGYSFFDGGDGSDGQFSYAARADAHFLWNHLYLDVYALRENLLRAHVADINSLATIESDEVGAAGEFKYSSKTSALFTLRYRETEFPVDQFQPEQVPVELLDRQERNGRVSVMHKTFPLTTLFVAAERSDYGFVYATYKDAKRVWTGAGALYNNGRTQLRVEGGPAKLDFDDPQQEDYTGLVASATFTRSNARWTYTAAAARDLGFSIIAFNNYFVATTARAGVDYVATRRLGLRAGTAWERDDYDVPIHGVDRRDTTSFTFVGFNYAIRRARAGVDVGWYERDSPFPVGDNASGIRYVLHLSFTP